MHASLRWIKLEAEILLSLSHKGRREEVRQLLLAELLRRPGIKAAGNGLLAAGTAAAHYEKYCGNADTIDGLGPQVAR